MVILCLLFSLVSMIGCLSTALCMLPSNAPQCTQQTKIMCKSLNKLMATDFGAWKYRSHSGLPLLHWQQKWSPTVDTHVLVPSSNRRCERRSAFPSIFNCLSMERCLRFCCSSSSSLQQLILCTVAHPVSRLLQACTVTRFNRTHYQEHRVALLRTYRIVSNTTSATHAPTLTRCSSVGR